MKEERGYRYEIRELRIEGGVMFSIEDYSEDFG